MHQFPSGWARHTKSQPNEHMAHILRKHKFKRYQRSKAHFILEGHGNTQHFHMVVNGCHWKKMYFQSLAGWGPTRGQVEVKIYIAKYYKSLFRASSIERMIYPKSRMRENDIVTSSRHLSRNKRWELMCSKSDHMEMFNFLHVGQLDLSRINFGVIILLI